MSDTRTPIERAAIALYWGTAGPNDVDKKWHERSEAVREDCRDRARAAIAEYLRAEAEQYPRQLPVTSFRHPGFLLLELASKAEGLEDDDAADETGPLVPYGTHSVFRP